LGGNIVTTDNCHCPALKKLDESRLRSEKVEFVTVTQLQAQFAATYVLK
jgi:hypothetical protein